MTPPSPRHGGLAAGTYRVLHLDRRRLALLGAAVAFLVIAVVFALLALFHATAGTSVGQKVPAVITQTGHVLVTPSGASAGASVVPVATPFTVTMTAYIAVPPTGGGFDLGAAESLASALGTVVAAGCALVALRPQRRVPPPAPAAATDAPASTPGS
jgi:hypothetical protein